MQPQQQNNFSKWLSDEQLNEIAHSLIFESRLPSRLEYLYNTYVEVNGIEMFDQLASRLKSLQNGFDNLLRKDPIWEGDEAGNMQIVPLQQRRKDKYFPTLSHFPEYFSRASHFRSVDIEIVYNEIIQFKLSKDVGLLKRQIEEAEASMREDATTRIVEGNTKLPANTVKTFASVQEMSTNKDTGEETFEVDALLCDEFMALFTQPRYPSLTWKMLKSFDLVDELGRYRMGSEKAQLLGIVYALRDNGWLPGLSDEKLMRPFCKQVGITYTRTRTGNGKGEYHVFATYKHKARMHIKTLSR